MLTAPVYLIVGIINLFAKKHNYNIKMDDDPDFQIRVKRDADTFAGDIADREHIINMLSNHRIERMKREIPKYNFNQLNMPYSDEKPQNKADLFNSKNYNPYETDHTYDKKPNTTASSVVKRSSYYGYNNSTTNMYDTFYNVRNNNYQNNMNGNYNNNNQNNGYYTNNNQNNGYTNNIPNNRLTNLNRGYYNNNNLSYSYNNNNNLNSGYNNNNNPSNGYHNNYNLSYGNYNSNNPTNGYHNNHNPSYGNRNSNNPTNGYNNNHNLSYGNYNINNPTNGYHNTINPRNGYYNNYNLSNGYYNNNNPSNRYNNPNNGYPTINNYPNNFYYSNNTTYSSNIQKIPPRNRYVIATTPVKEVPETTTMTILEGSVFRFGSSCPQGKKRIGGRCISLADLDV